MSGACNVMQQESQEEGEQCLGEGRGAAAAHLEKLRLGQGTAIHGAPAAPIASPNLYTKKNERSEL